MPERPSSGVASDPRSTTLTFEHSGVTLEFECFDNKLSRLTSEGILQGRTYPAIPAVNEVRTVVDVGANCGAASLFFSLLYPEAHVFAFEPASGPFALLTRNARRRSNIEPLPFGLHERDHDAPLYRGLLGSGSSSVYQSDATSDDADVVTLRSAYGWLEERSITAIDILKIDTEGCEVPILESIGSLVSSTKVVYLEVHSDDDRRRVDQILGDSHVLAVGKVLLGKGEMTYVNRSIETAASRGSH